MNTTLLFLHLSRQFASSPLLALTGSQSRVSLIGVSGAKVCSPFVFGHNSAFTLTLGKSVFTQSVGIIHIDHEEVLQRAYREDDLHIYDCHFAHIRSTDVDGGAVCVLSDLALVTMDRVTFTHCMSGKTGGAMWLEVEQADLQHVRLIDCKAQNTNNIYANCSQDFNMDCSTVYTDGTTAFSDSSLHTMALHVSLRNFNITREHSQSEYSAGRYEAANSIRAIFCTFQECQAGHYVLGMLPLGHTEPDVLVQFSNIYSNTLSFDNMYVLRVEGMNSVIHMVAFLGTSNSYYVVSHEGVTLSSCAFDVSSVEAIEPETVIEDDGCQWSEHDEKVHDLWIGGEADYSRLPTRISETYAPSRAKSMYFVGTKFYVQDTATYVRSYTELPAPTATATQTPTQTQPPTQSAKPTETTEGSLSHGTKVAIAVCVPLVLLILAGFIGFLVFYNSRRETIEKELWRSNSGATTPEEPLDDRALLA